MSEEHSADETVENESSNGISRRSALQKIGAASGAAIIGGSGVASADVTSSHRKSILSSPEVSSLREAVGGFNVQDIEVKNIKVKSIKLKMANIDTNIGDLIYSDIKGGETGARLDLSEIPHESDLWEKIRNKYNVAKGVDMGLIADESRAMFKRGVTDQERQRLKSVIPGTEDDIMATYSDEFGGYLVKNGDAQYSVADDMNTAELLLQPQVNTSGCLYECGACLSWFVSRGICYAGCAFVVTGAGLAVCVACLLANAAFLLFSAPACNDCVDCI